MAAAASPPEPLRPLPEPRHTSTPLPLPASGPTSSLTRLAQASGNTLRSQLGCVNPASKQVRAGARVLPDRLATGSVALLRLGAPRVESPALKVGVERRRSGDCANHPESPCSVVSSSCDRQIGARGRSEPARNDEPATSDLGSSQLRSLFPKIAKYRPDPIRDPIRGSRTGAESAEVRTARHQTRIRLGEPGSRTVNTEVATLARASATGPRRISHG